MHRNLTAEDWIVAAFRRLGQGGIAAVRAEVVARDLGVSKGSFYWHFRDLPDLRARMLAHWLEQATGRILTMTQQAGPEASVRLERLMQLATSDLADPYGGLSTEAAIRDWARTDPQAASAQAAADAARLGYLTTLMAQMGLSHADARQTARLTLMAYTGAVHMCISAPDALAADLALLMERLLRRSPEGKPNSLRSETPAP